MSNKNSWEYKTGFSAYASSIDDETYDFSELLECVEYKLNNVLSGEPIESCFPMTIGAGNPEHDGCKKLGDRIAYMLAEEYAENYGHPSNNEYSGKFWNDLADYDISNMWEDYIAEKTSYDANENEVLRLLFRLKVALSKIPCLRLNTEEIVVTLEEVKQYAPELLEVE